MFVDSENSVVPLIYRCFISLLPPSKSAQLFVFAFVWSGLLSITARSETRSPKVCATPGLGALATTCLLLCSGHLRSEFKHIPLTSTPVGNDRGLVNLTTQTTTGCTSGMLSPSALGADASLHSLSSTTMRAVQCAQARLSSERAVDLATG